MEQPSSSYSCFFCSFSCVSSSRSPSHLGPEFRSPLIHHHSRNSQRCHPPHNPQNQGILSQRYHWLSLPGFQRHDGVYGNDGLAHKHHGVESRIHVMETSYCHSDDRHDGRSDGHPRVHRNGGRHHMQGSDNHRHDRGDGGHHHVHSNDGRLHVQGSGDLLHGRRDGGHLRDHRSGRLHGHRSGGHRHVHSNDGRHHGRRSDGRHHDRRSDDRHHVHSSDGHPRGCSGGHLHVQSRSHAHHVEGMDRRDGPFQAQSPLCIQCDSDQDLNPMGCVLCRLGQQAHHASCGLSSALGHEYHKNEQDLGGDVHVRNHGALDGHAQRSDDPVHMNDPRCDLQYDDHQGAHPSHG